MHGGNQTRDLWDTRPMLYQLSYEVKSVRVGDISEPSLVPSISIYDLYIYIYIYIYIYQYMIYHYCVQQNEISC